MAPNRFSGATRAEVSRASAGSAGARYQRLYAISSRKIIMLGEAERILRLHLRRVVTRARCEPGQTRWVLADLPAKPRPDESSLSSGVGSTLDCASHEHAREPGSLAHDVSRGASLAE